MTTIIPVRSSSLPSAELLAVLGGATMALPGVEVRVERSQDVTMMDPATLALFVGAGATAVAGLVSAVATVWAARITARKTIADALAPPPLLVIVVEGNHNTVRVTIDPKDPAGSVAAAPLPASLDEVVGVRLERS